MKKSQRGFTLAEVAVVIVIIGIAMSMGLKVLTATMSNASYSDTKSKQEKIKTALISFLRTNGRLPCPDTSAGIPVGTEPLVGVVPTCTGPQANSYGVVPWVTLALSRSDVIDGWGNFFTYKVANGTASNNWTSRTLATPFDINQLTAPAAALTILELNGAGNALVPVTANAVVAIVSHGKNGFGAKTTKVAARLGTAGAGAGEVTNVGVPVGSTTIFVQRPTTEAVAAFNGAYDDIVAFMQPADLLQPLVTDGTLRACTSYCAPAAIPTCTLGGAFSCSAGTSFCSGGLPGCTSSGVPTCTPSGAPQCASFAAGCAATNIPVGLTALACP